jgi:hypothetical protein
MANFLSSDIENSVFDVRRRTGRVSLAPARFALIHADVQVQNFLDKFRRWASSQLDIRGVALVGSYARNEANRNSDVDLVIVTTHPNSYLQDTLWPTNFGTVVCKKIETYGKVTSLRVWYPQGLEVEYGFTDETWCALPIDPGTRKVIAAGMVILGERGSIFSRIEQSDAVLRRSIQRV